MPILPTPELVTAGRELGEPRCSPDDTAVAFTMSWGGRAAIVLVPSTGGPERLLTTAPEPRPGRNGGCFDWLPDGSGVVYAAKDGNLWLQPVPGGPPSRLTDQGPDDPASAPAVAPDGRRVAFVAGDLAAICLTTLGGRTTGRLLAGADFVTDPAWSPDGSLAWHEWSVPAMAWDDSRIAVLDPDGGELRHVGHDGHQAQQPRFGPDGALWCLRDDTGWLNVWVGDRPVLDERHEHGGPTWGAGQRSYAVAPGGGAVAVARNESGFGRLIVADVATGAVRELGRGVHQQVGWVGSTITAVRSGARTTPQVVAYDATTGARRVLAEGGVLGWEVIDRPEPEVLSWPADDGTELHARFYRSATPTDRTLCWFHGGPTDQWQVAFLPRVAYWVARGWNVFVPDPRGSTGHGRAYQQALRGRWGELDTADAVSGLRWLQAQGWAAPDRTVVIGGSAGGLTALLVLLAAPERCRAGVVSYPVSDLVALDETTHRFEAHYTATLAGPRHGNEHVYRDRSPLTRAAEIARPLLVFHGDQDPVVGVEQSRALVARVVAAGGDAELVEFAGEGHGFRTPTNQVEEYRRTAAFLARVVA